MHISLRTWDGTGSLFISEKRFTTRMSCQLFHVFMLNPDSKYPDLVRCISDWLRTMKESNLRSRNNFIHTLYLHRNSAQIDIDSLKFTKTKSEFTPQNRGVERRRPFLLVALAYVQRRWLLVLRRVQIY